VIQPKASQLDPKWTKFDSKTQLLNVTGSIFSSKAPLFSTETPFFHAEAWKFDVQAPRFDAKASIFDAKRPPIHLHPSLIQTLTQRIAAQALGKLTFHTTATAWGAQSSDLPGYDQWARGQVSLELGRAGYRLAAILKKVWP